MKKLGFAILGLTACLFYIHHGLPSTSRPQGGMVTKPNQTMAFSALTTPVLKSQIATQSDFRQLLLYLGNTGQEPKEREARAQEAARNLSPQDAQYLAVLAVAPQANSSEKFVAVYLLSQRPDDFARQLEEIAAAPNPLLTAETAPHTLMESQKHNEEALRAQAYLALDSRSEHTSEEQSFCEQGAQNPALGPFLNKLGALCAIGAIKGKPQVADYIEATLRNVLYAHNQ